MGLITRATSAASLLLLLLLHALAAVASATCYVPPSPPAAIPTTTYKSPMQQVPKAPKSIPNYYVPKQELTIAVKGTILCKSGYKTLFPILGAKAKVVCPVVNLYGKVETEVIISGSTTDVKGHFLLKLYGLSDEVVKNINTCKVKLEFSPLLTCKIATNVNLGVAGAPLSSGNSHIQENMKIYTVGPFFYTGSDDAPKPGY